MSLHYSATLAQHPQHYIHHPTDFNNNTNPFIPLPPSVSSSLSTPTPPTTAMATTTPVTAAIPAAAMNKQNNNNNNSNNNNKRPRATAFPDLELPFVPSSAASYVTSSDLSSTTSSTLSNHNTNNNQSSCPRLLKRPRHVSTPGSAFSAVTTASRPSSAGAARSALAPGAATAPPQPAPSGPAAAAATTTAAASAAAALTATAQMARPLPAMQSAAAPPTHLPHPLRPPPHGAYNPQQLQQEQHVLQYKIPSPPVFAQPVSPTLSLQYQHHQHQHQRQLQQHQHQQRLYLTPPSPPTPPCADIDEATNPVAVVIGAQPGAAPAPATGAADGSAETIIHSVALPIAAPLPTVSGPTSGLQHYQQDQVAASEYNIFQQQQNSHPFHHQLPHLAAPHEHQTLPVAAAAAAAVAAAAAAAAAVVNLPPTAPLPLPIPTKIIPASHPTGAHYHTAVAPQTMGPAPAPLLIHVPDNDEEGTVEHVAVVDEEDKDDDEVVFVPTAATENAPDVHAASSRPISTSTTISAAPAHQLSAASAEAGVASPLVNEQHQKQQLLEADAKPELEEEEEARWASSAASSASSGLRSDAEIQVDADNSFSTGNTGLVQWTNELLVHVLAADVEELCAANAHMMQQQDQTANGKRTNLYSTNNNNNNNSNNNNLRNMNKKRTNNRKTTSTTITSVTSTTSTMTRASSKARAASEAAAAAAAARTATANATRAMLNESNSDLHVFFSQHKQPFALDFYIRRLIKFANCSSAAFIVMLIYLDRVQRNCPALLLTEMNCHRLLCTALVLAIKYLDDEVFSNAYYARVGGVTAEEMHDLEVKMLKLLKWELAVEPETFSLYEEGLVRSAATVATAEKAAAVGNTHAAGIANPKAKVKVIGARKVKGRKEGEVFGDEEVDTEEVGSGVSSDENDSDDEEEREDDDDDGDDDGDDDDDVEEENDIA